MLKEGTILYFIVNGTILQSTAVHIQGSKEDYTFEIDGYGGCGGPHIISSHQLHHTVFLTREEAMEQQGNEAMYLSGHC